MAEGNNDRVKVAGISATLNYLVERVDEMHAMLRAQNDRIRQLEIEQAKHGERLDQDRRESRIISLIGSVIAAVLGVGVERT